MRAFFLFGEIRDRISADASGITLHRTWSVKSNGSVRLSIDVRFDETAAVRGLFPGVSAFPGGPRGVGVLPWRENQLSCRPVHCYGQEWRPAFLEVRRLRRGALHNRGNPGGERGRAARSPGAGPFPGAETPVARTGPRPDQTEPQVDGVIESRGSLEMSHDLFIAYSARDEISCIGASAVLERLIPAPGKRRRRPSCPADPSLLGRALQGTLRTHLLEKGGVAGMRELPGGPWISSAAGLGLAICMRRLFPIG